MPANIHYKIIDAFTKVISHWIFIHWIFSTFITNKNLVNPLPISQQLPIKQRILAVPTSLWNKLLSEKNVWKLVFNYLIEDKLKLLCGWNALLISKLSAMTMAVLCLTFTHKRVLFIRINSHAVKFIYMARSP